MREHSAKSAESEYVRTDIVGLYIYGQFYGKVYGNLAHAHAVDTRPSLRIIEGLGTGTRLRDKLMHMRMWAYRIDIVMLLAGRRELRSLIGHARAHGARSILVARWTIITMYQPNHGHAQKALIDRRPGIKKGERQLAAKMDIMSRTEFFEQCIGSVATDRKDGCDDRLSECFARETSQCGVSKKL